MTALSHAWARARATPETAVWGITFAVVSLPLVIAIVALAGRDWYPVLDLAMTEFRVRDVGGSHTPLIGLPGRIGPDDPRLQGSHPGPLSFYLLAPVYRLLGSSAYALEVATFVLAILAIAVALWLGRRGGGRPLILVVGTMLLVLIRGYGTDTLLQPWNPYLPLLFWVVVLLATWSVLDGDHSMLLVVIAAGSVCAQTHIPYLALVIGLVLLCVTWMVIDWAKRPLVRDPIMRAWQWSVVLVAALWLPVLIDQVAVEPGNISLLRDHFLDPPEVAVGFGQGIRLMLRHLDVVHLASDPLVARDGIAPVGSVAIGIVVVLTWIAAFVTSIRLRVTRLVALHSVVAAALLLGWISMSRIFGKVWYYLTLWAWPTTVLMTVAIAWTVLAIMGRRGDAPIAHRRSRAPTASLAALVGVAATAALVASILDAADVRPPEEHLSETLGALTAPSERALRSGAGAADGVDGTYLVRFQDALHFGSQAYGFVNELERRGLDVGMDDTRRVPLRPHRVVDAADATAIVVLVSGDFVTEWRGRPDAEEIASWSPTDDELARYAALEEELTARLVTGGLEDLLPNVRTNLFGIQLDERADESLQRHVDEMLRIGQPTSVFVAPATSAP